MMVPNAQRDEREKVKARIRALCAKTVSQGCTEAEALAAAELVGKLLQQYMLTMDECDLREERCVEERVPTNARRRRPIDGCLTAIARFCDCKVWMSLPPRGSRGFATYVFFGLESDVRLARYLYETVERAMSSEARRFRSEPAYRSSASPLSAGVSFQRGMASRVHARLEAMRTEREQKMAEPAPVMPFQTSQGTALVVAAKKAMVEEEFSKLDMKLRKATSKPTVRDHSAFSLGVRAGDRVNLNRPLEQETVERLAA